MQLFNALISAFLLTAAAIAQSDVTVHVVQVGLNGSLTFSPDSIQANPGEIVQFQFMAKVINTFLHPTNIEAC
jgi:plastocyanin